MRSIFNSRIFRRMLISIALVCGCFYALGLISNSYSRRVLKKQILQNISSKVDFFKIQLDQNIDSILKAQNTLVNNNNALSLNVLWDGDWNYDMTRLVHRISSQLSEIKELHNIADTTSLYFPRKKVRINAVHPIVELYDEDFYYDYYQVFTGSDGVISLTTYFPVQLPNNKGRGASYYCRTTITSKSLNRILNDMLGEDSGHIYLLGQNGYMISASGDHYIETEDDTKIIGAARDYIAGTDSKEGFFIDADNLITGIYYGRADLWIIYTCSDNIINESISFFRHLNITLTLLSIILLVSYTIFAENRFAKPINKIIMAMESSEEKYLIDEHDNDKDELIVIYKRYNQVIKHMENLIRENLEIKYRARLAELKQLQYQIQPHFLYNSLFVIYRMAKMADNEAIAEYARHLSKYYEYITRTNDGFVEIGQEYAHICDYLAIQQTRFGNRVNVEIEPVSEEISKKKIMSLILQPLVENAFEHGIKDRLTEGKIWIKNRFEDGYFIFTVEDNGNGLPESKLKELQEKIKAEEISNDEIHGLINTNARIRMKYKSGSGLFVSNRENGGFCATIKVYMEEIDV